jgi:uncharacterized protein (DUF58 family)
MIPYAEVARVDVRTLLRLAEPAAALPQFAESARALQRGVQIARFKGRGMEFAEVRPYQPGDDIRSLDWKVTARTGEPYTKLFREERERPVLLAVDLRSPMFFGTHGAFKAVTAAYAASLLAWVAIRAGDRIGGMLFADGAHAELKPVRGRAAVLHFIRTLVAHPAWAAWRTSGYRAAALTEGLARLRRVAKPGSLVAVLSDFRGLDGGAELELVALGRHTDVLLIQVYDPIEAQAPPPGRYVVTDGARRFAIDSSNRRSTERYVERFATTRARLRDIAGRTRGHTFSIATADDLLATLARGLRRRLH